METKLDETKYRKKAEEIFAAYPEADKIIFYTNGFVPNAYKWKALADKVTIYRDGRLMIGKYDRKRSYGKGHGWTAWSSSGGLVTTETDA